MTIYHIHNYNDAADIGDPDVTVELSDDESEIISIQVKDPNMQEESESIINDYVSAGMSPTDAIARFAGSYSVINKEGAEAVTSAIEEKTNSKNPADRIMSGALMALVNEDGVVSSLFKADSGTMMYRNDGEWREIVDPTTLEPFSFVGVEDSSLELYDKYQTESDSLVPIRFYPVSVHGPYWNGPTEEIDPEDSGEVVVSSIGIDSPEDIENAISAALVDQDLRWYVERRIAALGLEADLPWLKD